MPDNFRIIQPAHIEEQPPQPPGRPLTHKPKRTVTLGACVACRKRKSKCDGSRPICMCCTQKDTECVYELGPNEKPSQAMKRKNEEMQGELSNLRQLYDFIRLRPEHEAQEILRRIRANPTASASIQGIQELNESVKHEELLTQLPSLFDLPPKLHSENAQHPLTLPPLRIALDHANSNGIHFDFWNNSLGPEGPTSQRRRHMTDMDVSDRSDSPSPRPLPASLHAMLHSPREPELSDPRLGATRRWTSVTDNADFLSLIMSAWYKWEYSYHHFLDWDTFLDDLSDGKNDFCSEFLVNAVLASGCFHLPLIKDRSKPFSDNIMTQFYREARRLWELDEGHDSLPRLQGALCIFMVLGKHGRDKVGNMFLVEACRMARDMGLLRVSTSSTKPQHISNEKWEKVRAVTAWTLFNFQLTMACTYSIPAIITSQPPVAIPYEDNPYEEALFRHRCNFNALILEGGNTPTCSDESLPSILPKPEQTEILRLKMKSCYDAKPPSIDPRKFPSPENLLSAMYYNISIIRLFQPFLDHEFSSIERIRSYREQANSHTHAAIKEMRQLIMLQDVHHGWKETISLVLEPLMMTSFSSLEEVVLQGHSESATDTNEAYQGLLTCLRALSTVGNYVFYAQVLFRLLMQYCQKLDIPLSPEFVDALDHYQSEEWTRNAASVVSSQYIADLRKRTTDVENSRMDAIVSQWNNMSVVDRREAIGRAGQPRS